MVSCYPLLPFLRPCSLDRRRARFRHERNTCPNINSGRQDLAHDCSVAAHREPDVGRLGDILAAHRCQGGGPGQHAL